MKINAYLIRLSFSIMVIFGGSLGLHYIKTGDIFVCNLIATSVGVLLLLASWIWRAGEKSGEGKMV